MTYFDEIKKKSILGVLITSSIQGVSLVGGFILSILLSPEIFGVFTVVAATASFLSYFSDIGLAAALIQKEKKISEEDLVTTFTIQQILVIVLVVATLILSSYIAQARGFTDESLWLFRAVVIAFFLSSLKTIPSVTLERELNFSRLAIPQIVEVIVFNIVVVSLALKGWGIGMFTWAVIIRAIAGLIAIYLLKPWFPRFQIHKESAKKLISYGIPFQLNSVIALVKDNLFVMFLPLIMPLTSVGYVGWAKKYSEVPLKLIMDNIVRITFPTYSRLQNFPDKLSKGINKTLFILMIFIIPMSFGMIFVIKPLLFLIPKYLKWMPAINSFYLFVITSSVAALFTPLINALNAVGKIQISLKFMIFWTLFMWLIAPITVFFIGFDGIALTSAVMSLTTILVIFIAKKHLNFSALHQIKPSLVSAIIMSGFLFAFGKFLTGNLFVLSLYIMSGAAIYLFSFLLFFKGQLLSEVKYIVESLKGK